MFGPAYFGVKYYAPEYFAPGPETVVVVPEEQGTVGHPVYSYSVKRPKLKSISELEYEQLQRDDELVLLAIARHLDRILWRH